MSQSIALKSLLLLLLACSLGACSVRGAGGGGSDDDDSAVDDDDSADDDDATADDDDATADDDDATGDDDDATADDDDATSSASVATGAYLLTYWVDVNAGVPFCEQRIEFDGLLTQGPGVLADCGPCTGRLDFLSFTDVSNPNTDPDDCDIAALDADGANYGASLIDPALFGDFATPIGFIDEATHAGLGLNLSVSPSTDSTASGLESTWSASGLDYTHAGFIDSSPANSLGAVAGLEGVVNPITPSSDYLAAWSIARNPAANPNGGPTMEGEYFGTALFILTATAPDYDAVSFSLELDVTP